MAMMLEPWTLSVIHLHVRYTQDRLRSQLIIRQVTQAGALNLAILLTSTHTLSAGTIRRTVPQRSPPSVSCQYAVRTMHSPLQRQALAQVR